MKLSKRKIDRSLLGEQYDARSTQEEQGDPRCLLGHHVNVKVPSGSTHFDLLAAIARESTTPFPIKFLSEKLKEQTYPRGRGCFGEVAVEIAKIVAHYPTLRWWVAKDGLVVDEAKPHLDLLPHFDRIVGPLSIEMMANGKISPEALQKIAAKLDANNFKLKEHLPPAEWSKIVDHNQKSSGRTIKTFSEATSDRRFVRLVRRSIYRARDRYKNAIHHDL